MPQKMSLLETLQEINRVLGHRALDINTDMSVHRIIFALLKALEEPDQKTYGWKGRNYWIEETQDFLQVTYGSPDGPMFSFVKLLDPYP